MKLVGKGAHGRPWHAHGAAEEGAGLGLVIAVGAWQAWLAHAVPLIGAGLRLVGNAQLAVVAPTTLRVRKGCAILHHGAREGAARTRLATTVRCSSGCLRLERCCGIAGGNGQALRVRGGRCCHSQVLAGIAIVHQHAVIMVAHPRAKVHPRHAGATQAIGGERGRHSLALRKCTGAHILALQRVGIVGERAFLAKRTGAIRGERRQLTHIGRRDAVDPRQALGKASHIRVAAGGTNGAERLGSSVAGHHGIGSLLALERWRAVAHLAAVGLRLALVAGHARCGSAVIVIGGTGRAWYAIAARQTGRWHILPGKTGDARVAHVGRGGSCRARGAQSVADISGRCLCDLAKGAAADIRAYTIGGGRGCQKLKLRWGARGQVGAHHVAGGRASHSLVLQRRTKPSAGTNSIGVGCAGPRDILCGRAVGACAAHAVSRAGASNRLK